MKVDRTYRIAGGIVAEIGLVSLGRSAQGALPVLSSAHRVWFNPNQDETWFQSVSHLLLLRMVTIFAMLLPVVGTMALLGFSLFGFGMWHFRKQFE